MKIHLLVLNCIMFFQPFVHAQNIQAEFTESAQVRGQFISGDTLHKNVLLGHNAGKSLMPMNLGQVDGTQNAYIGVSAGQSDISGQKNVYVGTFSGGNVSSSFNNTFLGFMSGYSNTEDENTFIGSESGVVNDATRNVFVGYRSGYKNATGEKNTFLGHSAGRENLAGPFNTFLGYEAGCENTDGEQNTIVGAGSGYFNATGSENTFMGRSSGEQNLTGSKNTFIGSLSAKDNLRGQNNTFLGYNTYGSDIDSSHNQIVIGYNAIGKGHNMAVIGNGDITDIYMNQNGSGIIHANGTIISSDLRLKQNIITLDNNLNKILSLRPVSFSYKSNIEEKATGFIAQELKEILPHIVVEGENSMLGVKYEQMIAILVGAMQEQQVKINHLEKKIKVFEDFEKELKDLIISFQGQLPQATKTHFDDLNKE